MGEGPWDLEKVSPVIPSFYWMHLTLQVRHGHPGGMHRMALKSQVMQSRSVNSEQDLGPRKVKD